MRTLRGHFLIASHALLDPNFERSVVLMVKHDDEGAMGLILNAPLTVTVAEALGDAVELARGVDVPLHRGGPCQGPMMVLHPAAAPAASGDQILPGVHFTAARDEIEAIMSGDADAARYIIGYAGWGAEQLEHELDEGSWLTVEATAPDVFAAAEEQWERLSTKAGLTKFIPRDQIPDEPGLN